MPIRSHLAARTVRSPGQRLPVSFTRPRGVRRNVVAALTAVCILAPASIAFAQLAGVPPEQGLLAAPIAGFVYLLIGSARTMYVAPLAATALLTAVTVSSVVHDPSQRAAATAAMALIAGAVLLVTGLARCGFIVHFLRPEATTGFLFGLGVIVVVRELGTTTGSNLGNGTALERAVRLLGDAPHWRPAPVVLALLGFSALLLLERWTPAIPSSLAVLVVASVVTAVAHLNNHGIELVGRVPQALPHLGLPDLPGGEWPPLLRGALGLALITFVLSFGVAERLAGGDASGLDPNREMLALGAANLAAGAVGGMGSAGSPESSLAARTAGAQARWGTFLGTVALFVLGGWGGALFTWLPDAALAAVVIAAVRSFLSPRPLLTAWRTDRSGFAVAVCALLGVISLGLLQGLLIAVALSFLLVLATATRLHVSELARQPGTAVYVAVDRFPNLEPVDGAMLLRPDGQLFFANVDRVMSELRHAVDRAPRPPLTVLLDLGASFRLDQPTIRGLGRTRDRLADAGVELQLLHLYRDAADAVAASALSSVPVHLDTHDAVVAALAAADRSEHLSTDEPRPLDDRVVTNTPA